METPRKWHTQLKRFTSCCERKNLGGKHPNHRCFGGPGEQVVSHPRVAKLEINSASGIDKGGWGWGGAPPPPSPQSELTRVHGASLTGLPGLQTGRQMMPRLFRVPKKSPGRKVRFVREHL